MKRQETTPGRRKTLQIKPGARCTRGDRFGLNVRLAAVYALSKGANKKELAALLGCHPATLTNWQKDTPQEVLNWWINLGRGETPRDCQGCCPETALKGRRAAVCLLCNGASYADITKITGQDRRRLWGYLKEAKNGLCIAKATGRIDYITRRRAALSNPAGPQSGHPGQDAAGQDAPALV